MNLLTLIPARAGSKRVPKKNTRLLCNKPLIQYTIEHARSINQNGKIAISTDDPQAASIATENGCDLLNRPAYLANDKALTLDVVKHALEFYEGKGFTPDYVLLLQPTVPIREHRTLVEAIDKIEQKNCDSVTSHVEVDFYHPNRLKVISNGILRPYDSKELETTPRDQLPKVYCRDGSIYLFKSTLPFEKNSLLGQIQLPVISKAEYFVNIDDLKDWLLAEAMVRHYGKSII